MTNVSEELDAALLLLHDIDHDCLIEILGDSAERIDARLQESLRRNAGRVQFLLQQREVS